MKKVDENDSITEGGVEEGTEVVAGIRSEI